MLLTTHRLLLREFVEDDWPAVLAYQSDPRYLAGYPWTERTPDDVRACVQRFIAWQHERPRTKFQLAITLGTAGPVIGNCELAPSMWGRGYATEAARAMLAFGFERLHLHRVWAWCLDENEPSARVLERLGLRREGTLLENRWFKGQWHHSRIYAILEHEWRTPAV